MCLRRFLRCFFVIFFKEIIVILVLLSTIYIYTLHVVHGVLEYVYCFRYIVVRMSIKPYTQRISFAYNRFRIENKHCDCFIGSVFSFCFAVGINLLEFLVKIEIFLKLATAGHFRKIGGFLLILPH